MNVYYVEPIVKIFAEHSVHHFAFKIAVGGANDANIYTDLLTATHHFEGFFLNGPQKLDLDRRGKLCHFIKKEGSLMGCFKKATASCGGPGKRAFFVSEKLAFY